MFVGCGIKSTHNPAPVASSIDDKDAIVLHVDSSLEHEAILFEDMIESIRLVPLEFSSDAIVGHISNIIVTDNHFFVEDTYQSRLGLILFDKNGKFVKRYYIGNGPGEFTDVQSIFLSQGYLYVNSSAAYKINKYSISGDFLSDAFYKDIISVCSAKIGSNYLFLQEEMQNYERMPKLIVADSNLVQTAEYCLAPSPSCYSSCELVMYDDDHCLCVQQHVNDIFSFSNGSLKVKYRIDLSDYQYHIPEGVFTREKFNGEAYLQGIKTFYESISPGKYLFSGSVRESESYLSFRILGSRFMIQTMFYNKNTGKIWRVHPRLPSLFNTLWQCGKVNCSGQKDTYWSYISPDQIEFVDLDGLRDLLSPQDIELLKNYDPEDNPIVIIYKLKENL